MFLTCWVMMDCFAAQKVIVEAATNVDVRCLFLCLSFGLLTKLQSSPSAKKRKRRVRAGMVPFRNCMVSFICLCSAHICIGSVEDSDESDVAPELLQQQKDVVPNDAMNSEANSDDSLSEDMSESDNDESESLICMFFLCIGNLN